MSKLIQLARFNKKQVLAYSRSLCTRYTTLV